MAETTTVQSQTFMLWVMALLMFTVVPYFLLAPSIGALTEPVGSDPTNPAIKEPAKWVVWFWGCAFMSVVVRSFAFRKPRELPGTLRLLRVMTRFTWAFGCVLCLLHIALAFHLGHGWSHEAAWTHTKLVGGYGDGIYVNYAFALVWLADATWLCVAFDSYFARPRWLTWTIQGFLAFVVFNAAVVFGSWGSRKVFALLVLFILLAVLVAWSAKFKTAEPSSSQ